jgi:ribosomal protein S18 acetylase RimI-like enzyme
MIEVRPYADADFAAVKALWEEAFPDDPLWNKAEAAIPAKLKVQPELFLVALDARAVVGTAMAGYDGHRGWLYAVTVSPAHRRKGIGSRLVAEAETGLRALGCCKLNLQVRRANARIVPFYEALGFDVEERVSMGKRLTR